MLKHFLKPYNKECRPLRTAFFLEAQSNTTIQCNLSLNPSLLQLLVKTHSSCELWWYRPPVLPRASLSWVQLSSDRLRRAGYRISNPRQPLALYATMCFEVGTFLIKGAHPILRNELIARSLSFRINDESNHLHKMTRCDFLKNSRPSLPTSKSFTLNK